MKHNLAAALAFSAAALLATTPSTHAQSLISLDLGGGVTSSPGESVVFTSGSATSVPVSSVAPTSSGTVSNTFPTSAITTASGSDAPATSTVASSTSITSPAYAAGTVTYIPPPAPTSSSSIDVTLLPSSVPAVSSSASSNFTLPSATATGTFLSIPSNLVSKPYQIVFADTSGLPQYNWNLAMNSSSEQVKTALCASQMQFCSTAGCNDTTATLTNFCETQYMGTACSCSKGVSRLEQYQWPVMLADCTGRNGACRDACIKPGQGVADQNNCLAVCAQNYGNTCGKPGQYAANYAVGKKGEKPSYAIVQGGTAQNSAMGMMGAGRVSVVVVAALVSVVVLVGL